MIALGQRWIEDQWCALCGAVRNIVGAERLQALQEYYS
jgi:hypothetical protein